MENDKYKYEDLGLVVEKQDNIYIAYNPDLEGVVASGTTEERAVANYNIYFELLAITNGER